MNYKYTREKHCQVVISLLKAHGVRYVIASPGSANSAFVSGVQRDSYFKVLSSVDERSAAYMACGISAEEGVPVALSCTGATASRNYLPGMTEAYYRKLPIVAVTSTQAVSKVGHLIAQVIDRSEVPKDVVKLSVSLPVVKDEEDLWDCEIKVNKALLELTRNGGGPVHINLPTTYEKPLDVESLPKSRVIRRFFCGDVLPEIKGTVSIFVGAHKTWTREETESIDRFCAKYDAVVYCDHTSSYRGKYRVLAAVAAGQVGGLRPEDVSDLMIHIGEVSGDYISMSLVGREVWRVSEDGEIRDTFKKLSSVFEMREKDFFDNYSVGQDFGDAKTRRIDDIKAYVSNIRGKVVDLPFSNIWVAERIAKRLPADSSVHLGILNTLRSWNFFEVDESVSTFSNVGGFGIDGVLSTALGASLVDPEKLCFVFLGDLAFFYDMNALGNRHAGRNLRVLIINNGKGTEFRQYNHHVAYLGDSADDFVAASGHFGAKSRDLVKGFAEALGFEYLCADSKTSFDESVGRFLLPDLTERSMVFEVFTDSENESESLRRIQEVVQRNESSSKAIARKLLGEVGVGVLKKALGKQT